MRGSFGSSRMLCCLLHAEHDIDKDVPNRLAFSKVSSNIRASRADRKLKIIFLTDVNFFLEHKLNLQIATIDEEGHPMIQPTWFLYDKDSAKLYVCTPKTAKKVQNIMRNPDKVYFSIDDEILPYKRVKGRAIATFVNYGKDKHEVSRYA
jgi:uncharacterized pyridoxamine 5'-phosphate oxidase family protein